MNDVAGIFAREVPLLDRYVQLGIAQGRVLSVEFPTAPDPEAEPDHELLDRIEAYLDGEADEFADVTVAMTMPTDQRTVLEKVREVPYGEEATVEQITTMVAGHSPDESEDRATVREALGTNPAPPFIPTHRVTDGPDTLPGDVGRRLRLLEGIGR